MRFLLPVHSLIAAAVFFSLQLRGGEYLIQSWDTASGLPHSTVRSIAQTPDGYLWLGTENGLARFDGVRFENFLRENSPGLPNPNVEFLQCDPQGRLWAGAKDHLSLWDGRRLLEQSLPLAAGDQVEKLLSARTNEIIFSTAKGCVLRGNLVGGKFQWTSSPPGGPSQFALDAQGAVWQLTSASQLSRVTQTQPEIISGAKGFGVVNQIVADAGGRVWLGSENGLWQQDGAKFRAVAPPQGETDFFVTEIFALRDGSLLVAQNERLWTYKNSEWRLDAENWPVHQNFLLHQMEDRTGNVWFSRFGEKLSRLNRDGRLQFFSAADGLPADRVRSVFQDREGNVWIGIDRGGLLRLRNKQFQVLGTHDGLSDPVVLGICEDADGVLWASTYGGGVNRWAGGKFTVFNFGPDGSPGYVFTSFPDREKRLWVGTRDNGVFIREHGEFRQIIPTNQIPQPVRAIFQDRAGTVWLGSGAGVFCWRGGHVEKFFGDAELARADIRGFAEDAEGALWIGTHGNGVHRFKDGVHTAWHAADGLPNEFVRTLFAAGDGSVWIGMYGGGLLRWKNGALAPAAARKDLPDDVICHIEDDGMGQFWISTHHGLFRVAKNDLDAFADGVKKNVSCIVYGKADGLPAMEFSGGIQPSGWSGRDGKLWFATDDGLVALLPAAVTINPLPPPVAVENLLVDGELFASSVDKGKIIADLREGLRIPAGRTQFEFKFTALSYTAPDNVRFQYRLEGLQKDWVDAGVNRLANYNYLPPGEYKFHVRAANNDGKWNETGATVAFELLPHFWQRWWFRLLCIMVVIGLVWVAYYVRMSRLRELERLRLRIARDLHDDVGANLASLALIAEAMEKQPEFGDPADLRRIALHTIDSLRDIVWFIDPARDTLGDLISRMRDTAPLLLTTLKYDFEAIVPNADINLPPAFRRNVFPIFKEALHNAASHARAGHVSITLDCRDGKLRLKVIDDGIGFEENKIIPGNGLRNLRRRAAEMHGAMRIQTAPGQGTTVEFVAPFPRMRGFNSGVKSIDSNEAVPEKKSKHGKTDEPNDSPGAKQ